NTTKNHEKPRKTTKNQIIFLQDPSPQRGLFLCFSSFWPLTFLLVVWLADPCHLPCISVVIPPSPPESTKN
ncbi:hypothetical protein E4U54_004377, partial [Claviceps lovelessii]